MNLILSNLNMEMIEARLLVVTVMIMANLILSVWDAVKTKTFDVKKLPEFIGEWTMCVLSIMVIEIILAAMVDEQYIQAFVSGIKNIMFMSILACYLKKIYESLIDIGWDVKINIDKIKDLYGGK